jgi:hypothetical protein
MMRKELRKGSTSLEAAILFPLIIGLTIGGFALMTRWYYQWETSLDKHQKEMEQLDESEYLRILHWEQWGELLEDENVSE